MANTAEILTKLHDGVLSLYESDEWTKYLRFLANFRQYSPRNTLLIYLQRPECSGLVGSYTFYKSQHRHVRRGEKGIVILCPVTYRKKAEKEDEDGVVRITFRPGYVWDFDQTEADNPADNEDVPCPVHLLDSPCPDSSLFDVLASIAPVPVEEDPILQKHCNGYFAPASMRIVIRQGLPDLQRIKTLLHECAHAYHYAWTPQDDMPNRQSCEIVAESVAYTVCQYLGLDTAEYSFGYVATWASGRELKELSANLDVIQKIADHMISEIQSHYTV